MARNREKTGSFAFQIQKVLDSKLAIGQSKHLDKQKGVAQDKVYSWSTYHSYMKHANYFTTWAKQTHGSRTLEECRAHVDEWLSLRGKTVSAYTQKLEASALAKVYGCSTTDFVKTKVRHREEITRSRGEKVRDYHFSESRNSELIEFCRSTGLRRAELKVLTGDKLTYVNGKPYVVVDKGSKGGRYREVPIIGNQELVINKMNAAGTGRVFEKIHSAADIHSYRSDYATAYYKAIARPIEEIPFDRVNAGSGRAYQSEVYHCRGDLKGMAYDKVAMLEVSRSLGHNRISIIASNYLRG